MAMGGAELERLLMDAVRETDSRCVLSLLSRGADANTQVSEGVAAVHLAAGKDSERGGRVLELLLCHGADANLRSSEDLTPLHVAASWGCFHNLQLLLKHGGDPTLLDQDGKKPLDLAEQEENKKCALLLQEHEIHSSCEEQHAPGLQHLLLSSSFSPEPLDLHQDPLSSTRLSSASEQFHNLRLSEACGRSSFLDSNVCKSNRQSEAFSPVQSSTHVSPYPDLGTTDGDHEDQEPENLVDCIKDHPLNNSQNHSDPPVLSGGNPRKSVSFAGDDHYFSALGLDDYSISLHQDPEQTLDLSCYAEFVDRDRMVKVLQNHGIDVTSPDRVFVFCKEPDTMLEESEKTVLGPGAIEEEESSVSTGSSRYSSCSSDPKQSPVLKNQSETNTGNLALRNSESTGSMPLTSKGDLIQADGTAAAAEGQFSCKALAGALEDDFVASPFVTGRTQSRLSRQSERTLQNIIDLQNSSSLFEQTLPTPERLYTHTPRSNASQAHQQLLDTSLSPPSPSLSADRQSQADTHILSESTSDTCILSESTADTVLIAESKTESQGTSVNEVSHAFGTSEVNCEDVHTSDGENQQKSLEAKGNLQSAAGESWLSSDEDQQRSTCVPSGTFNAIPVLFSAAQSDPCISRIQSLSVQRTLSESFSSVCSSPAPQSTRCESSGQTPRYSLSRLSRHSSTSTENQSEEEPEEYLYMDTEQGHALIETRVPPRYRASSGNMSQNPQCEDTVLYDWRSLTMQPLKPEHTMSTDHSDPPSPKSPPSPTFSGLTDRELRNRLLAAGEDPGPINSQTRAVYIQRLKRALKKYTDINTRTPQSKNAPYSPRSPRRKNTPRTQRSPHPKKTEKHDSNSSTGFSLELEKAVIYSVLPDSQKDELALSSQFERPDQNQRWREGSVKSNFNYLLLDPRVTQNLPSRSESLSMSECFRTFLLAVFYVGKGKRSRPYSHLYEALEFHRGDKSARKLSSKVERILQIWKSGHGVVSLHCFQNVIAVEAYTREACMVEAMGLKNLTNQKRGDYYGVVSTWPLHQRRNLGVHLLFRAMKIFLLEGERQLRPTDI